MRENPVRPAGPWENPRSVKGGMKRTEGQGGDPRFTISGGSTETEVLGRVHLVGPAQEMRLLGSGRSRSHEWTGEDGRSIMDMSLDDVRPYAIDHMVRMLKGEPLTDSRVTVRFNTAEGFRGASLDELAIVQDDLSLRRGEDGSLVVTFITPGDRYSLEVWTSLERTRMGDYVLSRLNSRGCPNVPEMVGFSYWDTGGIPLVWSRATRSGRDWVPALRPYLNDLDALVRAFVPLEGEMSREFLLSLPSPGRTAGVAHASALGSQIAEMQIGMIVEGSSSGHHGDRVGDRIVEELSVSRMGMGDAGSLLGKMSLYMMTVKKEMAKVLGEGFGSAPSHRKQKVVRSSPRLEMMRSKGLEALPLFLRRLTLRERDIKHRASVIKRLSGSPMILGSVDTGLERALMDTDGFYVFTDLDWSISGDEEGRISKFLPLKDLALPLNSLLKARYLSSRRMVREMADDLKVDQGSMWLMYLDYNLSKPDYETMRKDFSIRDLMRGKDTPFRRIMSISMVGALWYELCQRSMVGSYLEKMAARGENLLIGYPKEASLPEIISTMQVICSLSEAVGSISKGIPSMASLESEFLNALTRHA